jgi:hypothetical protein
VIDNRLPLRSTTRSSSPGVLRSSGRPRVRVFFSTFTSTSSQRGSSCFEAAS